MCKNEPIRNVEEIVNKACDGCSSENLQYDANRSTTVLKCQQNPISCAKEQFEILTKPRLATGLKSRSDSNLYTSNCKNATGCKDLELSSFPSDSDITIIRVQKKSRMQNMATSTCRGTLGDGSHLVESLSMVNLATLVQGGESHMTKVEHLVSLSSWDKVDSPIVTTSDTVVTTARGIRNELRSPPIFFATFNKFYSGNIRGHQDQEQEVILENKAALIEARAEVNGNNIVWAALHPKLNSITKTSCTQVLATNNEGIEEIISNLDSQVEFLKHSTSSNKKRSFDKLFTRVQRAIHRTVHSCFPIRSDKNKLRDDK